MTEIMVHSTVGESFSFSESEFNRIESRNKSQLEVDETNDESTVIFSDKMDSDKSSESTICGSNSKDSVVTDDMQDSSSRTIKNNIFREGFKYMATETTVINATYNVISQSAICGIKEVPDAVKHQNPTSTVTNDKDESRVVVQILTSDAKKSVKSPDVIKNKSTNIENQSTHSFRDDVFKILSKSQSSKIDLGNSNKEIKFSKTLKVSESFQSTASEAKGSTQIERNRRKRSLKSFFLFGGGPKISDIEHVSTYLQTATPNALRMLHYVLYDKYGLCNSELQISQTRKNILRFCGYPFNQNSQEFAKRANCLKKIPRPILREVHQAIFGKTSRDSRILMVQQLMEFFLKPKRYQKIVDRMKRTMQFMLEEEYNNLKETALRGPLPSVFLQRLEGNDVERITTKFKMESKQVKSHTENVLKTEADDKPNYSLPAYILNGPGKKLKYFPSICKNVEKASEKYVSLLHYILYGRMESQSVVGRRNILEFSGFLKCQTDFIAERKATLIRLDQADLFELCKILCLRGKTNSRVRRIEKIMEYLQAPSNPIRLRGVRRNMKIVRDPSSQSRSIIPKSRSQKCSQLPVLDDPEEAVSDSGWRLRDFSKISFNIECSAPSDLTELNDLLFVKPCDETEIHEKILNFTRFGFTDTSTPYHYRKTLMFYMGPCIVRKIAKLLDMENWDSKERSHEDLSSSILNFLMEKKGLHSLRSRLPFSSFPVSSFNSNSNKKPEFQESFQSEAFQHQTNNSITCRKESVFIHRLSKSSVETNLSNSTSNALVPSSLNERNDVVSPSNAKEDSIPLRVFIHHPTDCELKQVIHYIIKDDLWHITLGDLVQKVYQKYPQFNLLYRENFIKTEARQMLSELRSNAFNIVQQHMSFNKLSV